jgi:hypothetical protein
MDVDPRAELEVIESTPAMVENCRSRGVATEAAIVSGDAPGRFASTRMVGKSTFGRSEMGRLRYATTPKSTIASMISVVATGRRMKTSERFTSGPPRRV